jgi:hypothetical protein
MPGLSEMALAAARPAGTCYGLRRAARAAVNAHAAHSDMTGPTSSATLGIVEAQPRDGRRDFDFLHGTWHVRNRRLLRPLAGDTRWSEFEGRSVVRPLFDGDGMLEEWEADSPTGRMRAISLHLYDPRARQWRLHWATHASGRVGVPTVGAFVDGRGEFHDQEDHEGHAILLRLIWEPRGPSACRFEQAYSDDGGRSWETNWTMDFTREP